MAPRKKKKSKDELWDDEDFSKDDDPWYMDVPEDDFENQRDDYY